MILQNLFSALVFMLLGALLRPYLEPLVRKLLTKGDDDSTV